MKKRKDRFNPLLLSALLALGAGSTGCGSDTVDADLDAWLAKARQTLDTKSKQLAARWGRPLSPEWGRKDPQETVFFDLDHAKIYWLRGKEAQLVADMQFVGSYKMDPKARAGHPEEAGSWRWSWDNENVPEISKKSMELVRRYGVGRRSIKLSTGAWIGPRQDGRDMLAAAVRILGAQGGYFWPRGSLGLYAVIEKIRKPKPDEVHPKLPQ